MNIPDPKLLEKAESGDAEAQYEVGNIYYFGKGVPVDHEKANQWYRKAADKGHRYAERALPFEETFGRKVDRWSKKSRKNQVLYGIMITIITVLFVGAFISNLSKTGRRAKERAKLSEELNQNSGIPRAYPLSYYTQDTMFLRDKSPYRELFDKAYQGDAGSQLDLCLEYMRGTELSKDLIKAFAWLKLACIYKKERPLPEEFTKVENEIKGQLSPTDEKAASTLAYQINKEIEAKIAAEKTGK